MVGCAGNGENVGEEGRVLICVGVRTSGKYFSLLLTCLLPNGKSSPVFFFLFRLGPPPLINGAPIIYITYCTGSWGIAFSTVHLRNIWECGFTVFFLRFFYLLKKVLN
jgi:hypothetical protein